MKNFLFSAGIYCYNKSTLMEITMKKLPGIFTSLGFATILAFASHAAMAAWTTNGKQLIDAKGNPFIFRGVTIDHTLAPEKTIQSLKDIAALGANSAQIEFPIKYDGVFPRRIVNQLKDIIKTCVEEKLVCVLEPNDVAGFGSVEGSASPTATAEYWKDIYNTLYGYQDYIIIGLGNQHFDGNSGSAIIYSSGMISYIQGLMSVLPKDFLVMIDGNVWSQDTDKAMQQIARAINQESSLKSKVIYSVDFFDQYANPEKIRDYIATFADINAPLVIGGFAPWPYYHPFYNGPIPFNAPRLPVESVMQYAEQYGAGYFGWSWSGNTNPTLDIVSNWNLLSLTNWGSALFNDGNGIRATAKRASIYQGSSSSYQGSSSSQSSSSTPANLPPIADFAASNYPTVFCGSPNVGVGRILATATGSSDPDGDALRYSWALSGGSGGSATGYEVTFPSQRWSTYQLTLTVTDSRGASTSITKSIAPFYIDCFNSSSSSPSSVPRSSSSSIIDSSSSTRTTSSSSIKSSSSSPSSSSSIASSSSSTSTKAQCSYQVNSEWGNGFTASIRIKNTTYSVINGWTVSWQYTNGSKITNLWNATLSGNNPYSARNLNWNASIQPGQTIEFGFQGSKPAGAASVPIVSGNICR